METQNQKRHIYIIDDEPEILMAVETCLRMAGMSDIITIEDSREVLERTQKDLPSLFILDLNMPHINGERLLEMLADQHPHVPVIILTGTIDVDTAVRCMKTGAMDYVVKPVEEERLLAAVQNARAYFAQKIPFTDPKAVAIEETLPEAKTFGRITTRHRGFQQVFSYIQAIAPSRQPVLIMGETGVGKELIAQYLHDLSNCQGQLVTVNVAGLDDNVFSDTLFGHLKGAFTGADAPRKGLIEQAAGGTLLLDEIGCLSLASQVKLLRLLQEKEYRPLGSDKRLFATARIIAATNLDLWTLEKKGKFRKDLIYRLTTHTIQIPTLKDRVCDLPQLIDKFCRQAAMELDKPVPSGSSEELIEILKNHPFDGNIRELRSMIFDAMTQYSTGLLTPDLFNTLSVPGISPSKTEKKGELPTLKEASDQLVRQAMEAASGKQAAAAKILGISQQALSKRLQKLRDEKK